MKDYLIGYLNIISTERQWSWTLIAILFFILVLIIRGWFLNPLVHRAKSTSREHFQIIKQVYIKRALWGWIPLMISIGLVILLWIKGITFPITAKKAAIALIAISGVILSYLLHLVAFGIAAIEALRRSENEPKIL